MDVKASRRIAQLKVELARALLLYRKSVDHLDCGSSMAAYISPSASLAAGNVNAIAKELRELDPDFPTSWTELPT